MDREGDMRREGLLEGLPGGVPASNTPGTRYAAPAGGAFSSGLVPDSSTGPVPDSSTGPVPDMATPQFARAAPATSSASETSFPSSLHQGNVRTSPAPRLSAAAAADRRGASPPSGGRGVGRRAIAVVFAAAALAVAAAAVIAALPARAPLCADQPEWNQYNCRQR